MCGSESFSMANLAFCCKKLHNIVGAHFWQHAQGALVVAVTITPINACFTLPPTGC